MSALILYGIMAVFTMAMVIIADVDREIDGRQLLAFAALWPVTVFVYLYAWCVDGEP